MTHAQLIALGSINIDFQVRAPRWPKPGETLLAGDYLMAGGGKGANVAYMGRRLGVMSRLLGRVGDDVLAEAALRPLRAIGVDLSATRKVPGRATGTALIVVRPDGQKTILLAANANMDWSEAEIREVVAAVRKAPVGSVLVTDLEVDTDVVLAALSAARERSIRTVLDPSPAERMTSAMYRLAGVLTPNSVEAEELTGIAVHSPEDGILAGRALRERGADTALVKLAAGGCMLVTERLQEYVPAPQVPIVDATGAGDAFAGALGVALLRHYAPEKAARFAVAAAAFAVTRYGSQPSYPSESDLQRLLSDT